jgi:hypothetical protein
MSFQTGALRLSLYTPTSSAYCEYIIADVRVEGVVLLYVLLLKEGVSSAS